MIVCILAIFMFALRLWPGFIYVRTTHKRNRNPKSFGGICYQSLGLLSQDFVELVIFLSHYFAHFLLYYESMA